MGCFFCGRRDSPAEETPPNRPINFATDPSQKEKFRAGQPTLLQTPFQRESINMSTVAEKKRVFGHQSGNTQDNSPPPYQPQNQMVSATNTANTQSPEQIDAPNHAWQAIPDNSDLPPPPSHGYLYSNTGNATEEDAERGHQFCDGNPLQDPMAFQEEMYHHAQNAGFGYIRPNEYHGSLEISGNGRWKGKTHAKPTPTSKGDRMIRTHIPMYFAKVDSPLVTNHQKTIYFEVKLLELFDGQTSDSPGFSIGYVALPYPTWRVPGWERGSVGVMSDDGCRYINDSFGGKEFTTEFEKGETVGLGMTFSTAAGSSYTDPQPPNIDGTINSLSVHVFLTRNGQIDKGWDLHEVRDAEQGTVEGLEGNFDLYGAIGFFHGVEFEACFDPSGWKWDPLKQK